MRGLFATTALVVILIQIFPLADSLCVMNGMPKGQAPKKFTHPTQPVTYPGPIEACPYYTGKPICCNRLQQTVMSTLYCMSQL